MNENSKNITALSNSLDQPYVNQVIIIGGGCAGLSAAIYCARAGLKPLLFAGNVSDKGGLLVKTSIVENYPGFPDGIIGFDLIQNMESQAINCGTTIINDDIINVDFSKNPLVLTANNDTTYLTKTIIIATGSKPIKLNLDNEDNLWAHGISSCAICDGALFRNKKIVVVGGGDSAMEEAQFLTKFSNVTLIHRRDTFRASKVMQNKVINNPKIKILYNTCITELIGDKKLTDVKIKNILTNEERLLPADGLFYGLGLKPNTKLFEGKLAMDNDGYILVFKNNHYETMTSVEGVFVAGDAHDKIYRQAVVACGDGCKAALDVNNFLSSL